MAGESILIVDDHPVNLKLTQLLLRLEGYQVHTATNAEDALRTLQTCPPRLVLLDLALPGMDGLELTRRLKADASLRAIPILALTAAAMKGDREKAEAAGCDGYITKPIDTRALPGIVARYLAGAAMEGDDV